MTVPTHIVMTAPKSGQLCSDKRHIVCNLMDQLRRGLPDLLKAKQGSMWRLNIHCSGNLTLARLRNNRSWFRPSHSKPSVCELVLCAESHVDFVLPVQ